jgi:type IV pilus biogenesis protein CpaD/CtpE
MYSLLIVLTVLGQNEIGVPPAPAADSSVVSTTNAEEMRTWLLARLVIDSAFDEKKSAEAQRLLATMNAQQLTALIAAYQERSSKTEKATVPTTSSADPTQQAALDQAKLNLQQAGCASRFWADSQ